MTQRGQTRRATNVDPAFLDFLHQRLDEEVVAAAKRQSEEPDEAAERGRRILDELTSALERGEVPDQMSLDLLTVAYARHPGFRKQWNRWLQAGASVGRRPNA